MRGGRFGGALFATALAFVACHDAATPTSELVVSVQTDVALPDSVDNIRLEVTQFGDLVFGNDYTVGKDALHIPATLGLVAGKHASDPVTIRLIARKAGKVKMLREVTTPIPPSRVVSIRMAIAWLCDDSAKETAPGQVANATCAPGQTCVAGDCHGADAAGGPTFVPGEIFGGGNGSGDGTCFDVVPCMSGGAPVTPDPTSCTFPKPAIANPATFNVALAVDNDGICVGGKCFVILDQDPVAGWQDLGSAIQLPHAVCTRLASGRIKQVVTTDTCPTKTSKSPPCGPWSSVGTTPVGPDAGGTTGTPIATDTTTTISTTACSMHAQGGFLFFCTNPIGSTAQRSLVTIPLAGGTISPVGALGAQTQYVGPWIATDQLLWMLTAGAITVQSAAIPPAGQTQIGALATAATFRAPDVTTAIDAQSIYLAGSSPSGLYAYPRAGGDATALVKLTSAFLSPLNQLVVMTADADPTNGFVYVATSAPAGVGNAQIERASKATQNGTSSLVATLATTDVSSLVLDGGYVYFVAVDPTFNGKSSIERVLVAGGTPEVLYPGVSTYVDQLAIDGDTIYWLAATSTSQSVIDKAPKIGGGTPALVVQEKTVIELFTVADQVYYANDDNATGHTIIKVIAK